MNSTAKHSRTGTSTSIVAKQISIPNVEKPSFITIFDFLMTTRHFLSNLSFSLSDLMAYDGSSDEEKGNQDVDEPSIINQTIAPTQNNEYNEDEEDSLLINSLKSFDSSQTQKENDDNDDEDEDSMLINSLRSFDSSQTQKENDDNDDEDSILINSLKSIGL